MRRKQPTIHLRNKNKHLHSGYIVLLMGCQQRRNKMAQEVKLPQGEIVKMSQENWNEVMRRYNTHEALVQALRDLVAWADGPSDDAMADIERARKLLANEV